MSPCSWMHAPSLARQRAETSFVAYPFSGPKFSPATVTLVAPHVAGKFPGSSRVGTGESYVKNMCPALPFQRMHVPTCASRP